MRSYAPNDQIENDQPPSVIGHQWVRVAAGLGLLFFVAHSVTVVLTCAVKGFDWGVNAWVLDLAGFLAGAFFAVQCWLSSTRDPHEFRSGNRWIAVWAVATVSFRVVDTLMLFGVLKWSEIYVTPTGWVLWSNVVSEVVIGMTFAMAALVGSLMLLRDARRPR
ncbi:MAG: hypothetical protein AAGA03_02825 [Planctomycetota bacterium]